MMKWSNIVLQFQVFPNHAVTFQPTSMCGCVHLCVYVSDLNGVYLFVLRNTHI